MSYSSRARNRVPKQEPVPVQHRFPSGKYRKIALIYALRAICLPVAIILIVLGIIWDKILLVQISLIPIALLVLFTLIFWSESDRVLCKICKSPFLKHLKCTRKKGKIPHFLGDRSLATSISLILKRPYITCQYCAERHKYFG